ncbi:MAG: efflux transporter outer membrane subunit [Phycisphaerales bacterium]
MLSASCLLLAGCVAKPPREELPLADVPAFSASGEGARLDRWWEGFNDEDLSRRIEAALADNFTLESAWERLQAARASVATEAAVRRPTLDGTGEVSLEDGSEVDRRSRVGLGLEASYEVDLWGRIRKTVEAERLRADATALDYRAAAISLSAETAIAWLELIEARHQLTLISSQIETNETVLEVLELRFAVGQSGAADVLRQRQLVEATREQAVTVLTRIDLLEHRLAVLEGRPPQDTGIGGDTPSLPSLGLMPAVGLPADLLLRRPDVRSVLLRIEAADRDVAAAVRDQYPRIDLLAAAATVAENPGGLFDAWLASMGAQLIAPLYDGGRREAEIDRRVAIRRQLVAQYGQTVLDALAEVEDAMANERRQSERLDRLETRLDLAERTYAQLRTEYLNGVTDFIDVLTALEDQQRIERDLLAARLDRLLFRVTLHRAIAGGFATTREQEQGIRSPDTPETTARSDEPVTR